MANRDFYPHYCDSPERVHVFGSFAPDTANAPTALRGNRWWTVAHTSTGLFTVTFTLTFDELDYFTCKLGLATGADKIAQNGTWVSPAHQIRIWDISDAAVADVAANADNRVNFHAVFRCTKLTP